jgi:phospholipase/lecithinase/hemolysin
MVSSGGTLVSTCDDPDTFVWWDGLHPTAAVHVAIGADIAAALEGIL